MVPARFFRPLRRVYRDERGTGMIELALFAPILALFTVGIVDLGTGLTRRMELHQGINRTLERIAARDFEITDGEGKLDSAFIKADIVNATGVTEEQITVNAWLECDGDVQMPEAENFNGTCDTPADADPKCGQPDEPADAKCEAILARYVEISIVHPFRPQFAHVLPVLANGTIPLTAEAAVRIQ
jgi:Flp pilus assembly pilin Flp